jgi:aminoglycoside phosphotransferase
MTVEPQVRPQRGAAPGGTIGLAPDPVLARRDELLDVEVMAARLGALLRLAGEPASCTRLRAKYRIGESLRVTFRVETGSSSHLVSSRMFPAQNAPDQAAKAHVAARRAEAPEGSVLFDPDLGTMFWVFPQDRKLRGLDQLTVPDASLRDVFGTPWARSQLMAYSPEKAATARCMDAAGATIGYAKVQVDDDGAYSIAAHRRAGRDLPAGGPLVLPRGIAYLSQHQMAFYSPAPGVPMNTVPRSDVPAAMSALGAALTVLHDRPQHGFTAFTRFAPDRVRRSAELVAAARPDVATDVLAASDLLLRSLPRRTRTVLLHGDLHPKNVLVHEAGVSLVDLDQAGTGPAEAELGGLLARMWWPRTADGFEAGTAAAAGDALLAAYAADPDEHALRWYAAASLLVERAVRAVNRVDPVGLGDLAAVAATARQWTEELSSATTAPRPETRP